MLDLFDSSLATVWFRGHPYPVSTHPDGPARSSWYVLLEDGQWHRVRDRLPNETPDSQWSAVEADILRWLEQKATGSTDDAEAPSRREYAPPRRDGILRVSSLAFESGSDATDFVRRLNVLFDPRSTRLVLPSMPVVILGPALIDSDAPVTLYAGRGTLALAKYLGLTFPAPGDAIDARLLSDLDVVFGAIPTTQTKSGEGAPPS